jgi:hypothetical protein
MLHHDTFVVSLIAVLLILSAVHTAEAETVSGFITTTHGPLKDAAVKLQGTDLSTKTDDKGKFTLSGLKSAVPVTISAWKDGYYAAMKEKVVPPASDVQIQLVRYQLHDNSKYSWIPPTGDHPKACDRCHDKAMMEMTLQDPHMNSGLNQRFLSVYKGTDMLGNRNFERTYRKGSGNWATSMVPNEPEKDKPYYGPGLLTDTPDHPGNCSGCHAPVSSVTHNVRMDQLHGADKNGIHCDFCHKVADVKLDQQTRLPFQGTHGVHAMKVLRPFDNKGEKHQQLFFGPFDDPYSTTSTKLPLISKSQFCASCHRGIFWEKLVYNSYGEWLESPYGKEGSPQFKTCQNCHMVSPVTWEGKTITNTAPGRGGIERDPSSFKSHRMTIDKMLLGNALTMTAAARREPDKVFVDVELYNDKTGHHVPSDSPLRHLILHIEAKNSGGKILKQISGPVLPEWCGSSGKVSAVAVFAGKPGKAFAKLLKEKWTNEFPTAAYWNDFDVVSDNRLAAFARDKSRYGFEKPGTGDVTVTASLYYRRAYYQLMEWKKWSDADILMARQEMIIR